MSLLAPAGALALIGLPAIALLYFLKIRRPRLPVSTLLFWRPHLEDRHANAPWQRIRAGLLLLLQLAAAAAVALALMRPALPGAAGITGTTVVLLDGSASMTATDATPSRFGAAVARTRRLASQLGPGQRMAVIELERHARLLAAPTSDPSRLAAALDAARPGTGPADFGEGASLADAILAGREGSIVLIGDGHLTPAASPPTLAAPLTYLPVGTSGENTGIEAIAAAPQGIFMRIVNYGRRARDLQVRMIADGRLADVLPAHIEGGSSTDVVWTRLPAGTRILEASLTPGDAFALDDNAWLPTGTPIRHRALLVTAENGFLARALRLHPGLDVRVVKPAGYRPGPYDLYVFDGWVPPGPLPQPALVVAPPLGRGPVPAGPAIDPGGVLPAAPDETLLRDVNLADVHVQAAARVVVPPGWRTVVSAVNGPLLLIHEGSPAVAELTFDIHRSDLPLRAAFPILIQNLVARLLPGAFEGQVLSPGDSVPLVAEPGARRLEVTTPGGTTARLAPPFPAAPFTDTSAPGVYTVRQLLPGGGRTSSFVVDFQDPAQSRIQPGAAPPVSEATPPARGGRRGTLEVWPWLAAAALALLAAEWLVFLRRA
ncbi:MAG: vWA domain-containing protein [Candidatus Dormibacteraceae bacterium]